MDCVGEDGLHHGTPLLYLWIRTDMVVVSDLDTGIEITITTVNGRQFSGTTDRVTDANELYVSLDESTDADVAILEDQGDALHVSLDENEPVETDTIRKNIAS